MIIEVKYFGRIVEYTLVESEAITITEAISISDFRKTLWNRFPGLQNETFKIALDQQLVAENVIINSNCEVAILPPFAGG